MGRAVRIFRTYTHLSGTALALFVIVYTITCVALDTVYAFASVTSAIGKMFIFHFFSLSFLQTHNLRLQVYFA